MTNYTVFVDDNFHYLDEDKRYKLGDFDTWEAAVAACQKIVDDFLLQNYKTGMKSEELYRYYTTFGEEPFIIQNHPLPTNSFSASNYARQRCQEICAS